jgi:transposase
MGKRRKNYSREFKLEAVKMVIEQSRSVREVADGLGVSETVLHRWKSKFLRDGDVAFPGQGRLKPDDEELRRLRRELSKVKQERDILKKAMAYFAKDEI